MQPNYAYYKIKDYYFEIGYVNDFIVSIKIVDKINQFKNKKSLLSNNVKSQLEEYFKRKRKKFDFKYKLFGTDFEIKVWNYLTMIPYGETKSYKDVAIAINHPKACRAVGNANNKNPIVIVIPCHRVIKSNNQLGGYALGTKIKEDLLNFEKNNLKRAMN